MIDSIKKQIRAHDPDAGVDEDLYSKGHSLRVVLYGADGNPVHALPTTVSGGATEAKQDAAITALGTLATQAKAEEIRALLAGTLTTQRAVAWERVYESAALTHTITGGVPQVTLTRGEVKAYKNIIILAMTGGFAEVADPGFDTAIDVNAYAHGYASQTVTNAASLTAGNYKRCFLTTIPTDGMFSLAGSYENVHIPSLGMLSSFATSDGSNALVIQTTTSATPTQGKIKFVVFGERA